MILDVLFPALNLSLLLSEDLPGWEALHDSVEPHGDLLLDGDFSAVRTLPGSEEYSN